MKKIHRFFYNFEIVDNFITINNTEIIWQIKNVLKLNVGEKIYLFFEGLEALCSISTIDKKNIKCSLISKTKLAISDKNIVLYCAILKKDNFELVVQKASEIGINRVVPIITERTIKTNLNIDRLNSIAREACEQSGRCDSMIVDEPIKLKDIIKNNNYFKLFFDFSGEDLSNLNLKKHKSIALFIGPEGGFTETEVDMANKNSCTISKLGKNVLRGETAAIVASYLIVNN